MTKFSDLKLAPAVSSVLDKIGYDEPTPIQAQAIPSILKGRDIQGVAQTGTGKTAAFTLPILSRLADDPKTAPKRSTRVLILSPTRELASQIGESVVSYARHIDNFKSTVIFGGVKLPRQIKRVVPGNDVIVATPGRLLDLMNQKVLNLSAVEYLILDEADQMMDMGFIHALRKIIPHLPEERQTLFFSATMPKSITKLADQFLTNPVKVAVTPESTTAERVEQSVIFAQRTEKANLLSIKLLDPSVDRALVFTRTKHGADRLVKRLASVGLKAVAIHGNKSQGQRTRALGAFKSGETKILVATDVAARGIDIRGVSHVFNYEIPNVPEQYVHRIGRTGRAGEAGIAIAFVGSDEKSYLRDIQKMLKMTIPVEPMPSDFKEQAIALKKRPALTKEEMGLAEPQKNPRKRKGRKSRPAFGDEKKTKTSKHRKGPSAKYNERGDSTEPDSFDKRNDAGSETPYKAKHKKKAPSGKPSRADRKRGNAAARGEDTGFKRKPRRKSGEASGEGQERPHSKNKRVATESRDSREFQDRKPDRKPHKGRKPQKGRKPYRGDKPQSSDRNRSETDGQKPQRQNRPNTQERSQEQERGHRGDGHKRSNHKGAGRKGSNRPNTSSRDGNRERKDGQDGRRDGPSQQGGYGSPKRRSSQNGNTRNQGASQNRSDGQSKSQKPTQGQNKNKFKRKPRANSRPSGRSA